MKSKTTIILALLLPLLLVCTRDYNPFSDRSQAQVKVLKKTFAAGDTIEVFERETLSIAVTVVELVDSFRVTARANRLFDEDTTIPVAAAGITAPFAYPLVVSFYDTGWQTVEILTFRAGGEQVGEQYRVYCRLPYAQPAVRGSYGGSVHLVTTGVHDNDAIYHWDFGRGTVVQSPFPDTMAVIQNAGYDSTGYLWVTDARGLHAAPKAPFVYIFNDTIGPTISCVNEGCELSDTLVTGATTFFFRADISDRGTNPDTVSINGKAFDLVEGTVYAKVFNNMDTISAYLSVTVWAQDNDADKNVTTKTFYLGYDASLPSVGEGVAIVVQIPSRDSTISTTRSSYVLGSVENYTGEQVVVNVSVNGAAAGTADTLPADFSSVWGASITLGQAANSVRVTAASLAGAALDDTTFTMLFDSTLQDTVKPVILSVTLDGKEAEGAQTESDTAHLRIIAFDEASGISALQVNGVSRAVSDTPSVWHAPVALEHSEFGTNVVIRAQDGTGLWSEQSVTIFKNRVPVIKTPLNPPYPIVAGGEYRDTLIAEDGDGDRVYYDKAVGPSNLKVSDDGVVSWTPPAGLESNYELIIRYQDGISSQLYSCSLHVVDSTYFSNAVTFGITEQAFPSYAEAGTDTIKVRLSLKQGAGTGPFSYAVLHRVGSDYESLPISTNEFVWYPQLSDTGYQHFVIRVTDQMLRSDTLFPGILIVPQNRAFDVSLSHSIDTLGDGTIDMGNVTSPETLLFVIDDPDTDIVESYRIVTTHAGGQDIRTLDGDDTFSVVLDKSKALSSTETYVIEITDRGNHADTLTVKVSYVPHATGSGKIILNTSSDGANVTGDVHDFPVLIRLTSSNFDFGSAANDGSDIRFKKPDGTVLPHEIERFDARAQKAEIWVKVDTVKGNNATQYIKISTGNTGTGASNGPAVFDTANGFQGVWHLGEDPQNGTADAVLDHTGRQKHGIADDSMGQEKLVDGAVGKGMEFDGVNDKVMFDTIGVSGQSTYSFSLWMKADENPGTGWYTHEKLVTMKPSVVEFCWGHPQPEYRTAHILKRAHASWSSAKVQTSMTKNVWYHVYCDYDGDTMRVALNGNIEKSTKAGAVSIAWDAMMLGFDQEENNYFFEGIIDEFRFNKTLRSTAWIKLSYENQKQGSLFAKVE